MPELLQPQPLRGEHVRLHNTTLLLELLHGDVRLLLATLHLPSQTERDSVRVFLFRDQFLFREPAHELPHLRVSVHSPGVYRRADLQLEHLPMLVSGEELLGQFGQSLYHGLRGDVRGFLRAGQVGEEHARLLRERREQLQTTELHDVLSRPDALLYFQM